VIAFAVVRPSEDADTDSSRVGELDSFYSHHRRGRDRREATGVGGSKPSGTAALQRRRFGRRDNDRPRRIYEAAALGPRRHDARETLARVQLPRVALPNPALARATRPPHNAIPIRRRRAWPGPVLTPEEIDAADGQAFSSDSEGEVPVARGRQLERVCPCGVTASIQSCRHQSGEAWAQHGHSSLESELISRLCELVEARPACPRLSASNRRVAVLSPRLPRLMPTRLDGRGTRRTGHTVQAERPRATGTSPSESLENAWPSAASISSGREELARPGTAVV